MLNNVVLFKCFISDDEQISKKPFPNKVIDFVV